MKKILAGLLCILSSFAFCICAIAKEKETSVSNETATVEKINVYLFSKEGCPHCEEAREFFSKLAKDKEYSNYFELVEIQVWDSSWTVDEDNKALLDAVAENFDETIDGAPYIVMGDSFHSNGFSSKMEKDIKKAIKTAYDNGSKDLVATTQKKLQDAKEAEEESSDVANTVIGIGILVVIIGGVAALVIFARKAN